ncbi:MAG: TIGR02221 family CRISPR-associated protein [Firmicutes bacterium]|nr:TIGR02221 family CRISPR-associated protein [Bacillota bacterium]
MAKVLISALGTGKLTKDNISARKYEKTVYRFQDSQNEYETSFIAAALSEHFQVDKLYLVGTSKSMWEEVYDYFSSAGNQCWDQDYWLELGDKVASYKVGDAGISEDYLNKVNDAIDGYLTYLRSSASGGSHCFIIDYGLNEKELWSNFDVFMRIGENLGENDEIYLDITHAFRSIPLFIYLMLDLITILESRNNLKITGLFYGMLEATKELGYTPIVDLSPLYNITLWARGAYNFINFGNGYLLADLIKDDGISETIRNISDLVNINYIDDFKREIDRLNHLLKNTDSSEQVVRYMQPYLQSFVDKFKGISSSGKLQFSLAQWYFDNYRFAHGYICLTESIITRILEIYRERNSKISWGNANRGKIKTLIEKLGSSTKPEYSKAHEVFNSIRKIRNLIAHAGYSDGNTFREDIGKAYSHLNNVEKYVFNNKALEKLPDEFPFNQI